MLVTQILDTTKARFISTCWNFYFDNSSVHMNLIIIIVIFFFLYDKKSAAVINPRIFICPFRLYLYPASNRFYHTC